MPQYYTTLTKHSDYNGQIFRLGLNTFSTYICELNHIYINGCEDKLAYIRIPDGIRGSLCLFNIIKVPSFYIDSIIDISEHPEYNQICLNSVNLDSSSLAHIPVEWQTEIICRAAVSKFPRALKHVVNQTKELCKIAVRRNGYVLDIVKPVFRTADICELAVRKFGTALKYVPPDLITQDLCMLAVKQSGWALKYVPDEFKTYELCVEAVARTSRSLRYILNN